MAVRLTLGKDEGGSAYEVEDPQYGGGEPMRGPPLSRGGGLAAKIGAMLAEGPQLRGVDRVEKVPHPRKEGWFRHVTHLQVPTRTLSVISDPLLDVLEYSVCVDRDVALKKAGKEWVDALRDQRAQIPFPRFALQAAALQAQKEWPFKGVRGSFLIVEVDPDDDWDDEPDLHYAPLGEGFEGGVAWSQGRRFKGMEDAHASQRFPINCGKHKVMAKLSGVYDGHGGPLCAQSMAEHFHRFLQARLEIHNKEGITLEGLYSAIKTAFVDFTRSYKGPGGTCAIATLEIEEVGVVCVANTGDSRAFLMSRDGQVFQLSHDQKVPEKRGEPPTKFERSYLHRGLLPSRLGDPSRDRVCGLNVARAVGDKIGAENDVQSLSARPKIVMPTRAELEKLLGRRADPQEEFYLFQGCDGLFDVGTTDQYAHLALEMIKLGMPLSHVAAVCAQAAYNSGSGDNLTAMIQVVRFA